MTKKTWETLKEMSNATGETMQGILEKAVEEYRRHWILKKANEAYAVLKANEKAWQEELAEREEWETTLGDDLGDD